MFITQQEHPHFLPGQLEKSMDITMVRISIIFLLCIYKIPWALPWLGTPSPLLWILSKYYADYKDESHCHLLPKHLPNPMVIGALEQTFKALHALTSLVSIASVPAIPFHPLYCKHSKQLNFSEHSFPPGYRQQNAGTSLYHQNMRSDYWHLFATQCSEALRLAMVGVLIPQTWPNTAHRGFSFRHLPGCADEQSNK